MEGDTTLHAAVQSGDLERLCLLLDSGSDPNVRDVTGNTSLHLAFHLKVENLEGTVRFLVGHGADITAIGPGGLTPLHLACRSKNIKLVGFLLKNYHADVNIPDEFGNTCLHLLHRNGYHANNAMITFIVCKHGGELYEVTNNEGMSVFDCACVYGGVQQVDDMCRVGMRLEEGLSCRGQVPQAVERGLAVVLARAGMDRPATVWIMQAHLRGTLYSAASSDLPPQSPGDSSPERSLQSTGDSPLALAYQAFCSSCFYFSREEWRLHRIDAQISTMMSSEANKNIEYIIGDVFYVPRSRRTLLQLTVLCIRKRLRELFPRMSILPAVEMLAAVLPRELVGRLMLEREAEVLRREIVDEG